MSKRSKYKFKRLIYKCCLALHFSNSCDSKSVYSYIIRLRDISYNKSQKEAALWFLFFCKSLTRSVDKYVYVKHPYKQRRRATKLKPLKKAYHLHIAAFK